MESFNQECKSENLQAKKNLRRIIGHYFEESDIRSSDKYIDLNKLKPEEAEQFLCDLEEVKLFVFHGNPSKELLSEIQPRNAKDNLTVENSMNAVFASPRYLEALAYGVIHKFNLSRVWKGYTLQTGHEKSKGVYVKSSPEINDLIKENKSEYLQDVLLYVLNRDDFKSVAEREGEEFYSKDSLTPLATLFVPREVAVRGITFESFGEEELKFVQQAELRVID